MMRQIGSGFGRTLSIAMAVALPIAVSGQVTAHAADPSDPKVTTPSVTYRSAFDGYARWQDDKKSSWRESNDAVGRLGGHIGHTDDADAGTKSKVPEPQAGNRPASDAGHSQHHKP